MNKIDTLFTAVFLLCFAPIAIAYVVGVVTNVSGHPTSWNRSLIMPVWMIKFGAIVMGASALAFYLTGLTTAATTVFGICVAWIVLNIGMVVTATHFESVR